MIDKSFIEKILELADAKKVEIDGRTYYTKSISPVHEPTAEGIQVGSLTAIMDYLKDNKDSLDLATVMIHVERPDQVEVFSALIGNFKQRETYLIAAPRLRRFPFGQYMAVEQFIISLQSLFVQDDQTAKVIRIAGNLTDGKTTNYSDDGVTQQVTAKVGITRVENVPVPNPVELAPYRTFMEIGQPKSDFLFRIKSQNDQPYCALYEADGGYWELEAMESIKKWLTENVPKGVTILA